MYREGIKHHTVRCNGDINIFCSNIHWIGLRKETGNRKPNDMGGKAHGSDNCPMFVLDPEYLRDPKSQKLVTWHVGEYTRIRIYIVK